MTTPLVNIDFTVLAKAMQEHVRKKAIQAGSTIIYEEDGVLIEEDPKNSTKTVLMQAL